jgi:hypothetical protein
VADHSTKPSIEYQPLTSPPKQGRKVLAAIGAGMVCGFILTAIAFTAAQRAIGLFYGGPEYKRELIEAAMAVTLFVCLTVPSAFVAARLALRRR